MRRRSRGHAVFPVLVACWVLTALFTLLWAGLAAQPASATTRVSTSAPEVSHAELQPITSVPRALTDRPQAARAQAKSAGADRQAGVKTEPAKAPSLEVTVESISPQVLTDQTEVTVTATVTAHSKGFERALATLSVREDSAATMAELTDYLRGKGGGGLAVGQEELSSLQAGQARTVTFKVPTHSLPIYDAFNWGPRGVEVSVQATQEKSAQDTDADAGTQASSSEGEAVQAAARSVIIWDSQMDLQPVGVTALVPVGTQLDKDLKPQFPAGTLVPRLTTVPGVAVAAESQLLNTDKQLVQDLVSARQTPVTLPALGANLADLAHTKNKAFIKLAKTSTGVHKAADEAQLPTVDNVVWARGTALDRITVRAWADRVIITSDEALAPVYYPSYTPSAVFSVDPRSGVTLQGDAANAGTRIIATKQSIDNLLAQPAKTPAEEFNVRQLLRASTAIITRELPHEPRSIAVAAPTELTGNTVERLRALMNNSWVKPTPLNALMNADITQARVRETLVEHRPTSGINASQAEATMSALASTNAVAGAVADTDTQPAQLRQDALLVARSVKTAKQREQILTDLKKRAQAISTALVVARSAPINLLDSKTSLPITVSNKLADTANVTVTATTLDPRLRLGGAQKTQVAGRTAKLVRIPTEGIGSGNVKVRVSLTNPQGKALHPPREIVVRVRAGWESKGTFAIGAALAVLLVIGVVRSIRGGRRASTSKEV
ncbi:DUF6049 family protein [Gleimia hominis]|uniref:DUF6049 family protein n=1 Tax=Gleimia hominis TaxID=595468 RepID=A0ABU3I8R4_9ACTO|nr:DUF6049 family protein [Gleimia hominis]MDT3766765.1 DUF6049 family protein [Gleimia hominis]